MHARAAPGWLGFDQGETTPSARGYVQQRHCIIRSYVVLPLLDMASCNWVVLCLLDMMDIGKIEQDGVPDCIHQPRDD